MLGRSFRTRSRRDFEVIDLEVLVCFDRELEDESWAFSGRTESSGTDLLGEEETLTEVDGLSEIKGSTEVDPRIPDRRAFELDD